MLWHLHHNLTRILLVMMAIGLLNCVAATPAYRLRYPDHAASQTVQYVKPPTNNNNNNTPPLSTVAKSAKPEQVHLSYPGDNQMRITWLTQSPTSESMVWLGSTSNSYLGRYSGSSYPYLAGLDDRWEYVHVVTLSELKPATRYYYRCGSTGNETSEEYSFKTMALPGNMTKPLRVAVLGDFGLTNARSLPGLIRDVKMEAIDMGIHVGDIAYNLWSNEGVTGDAYLNQLQPFAANVPYHTCPGNHENDYGDTFMSYKMRFAMPQVEWNENMYYSIDIGPVHFIAFSTEHYFSVEDIFVEFQYAWLIADLEKAVQNRQKVPWIVMYGHRPLYCSNAALPPIPPSNTTKQQSQQASPTPVPPDPECTTQAEWLREGMDILGVRLFGIEKLLHKYGVDLYLAGHMHSYERTFPVYNNQVKNGTQGAYIDPKATVHIITGSAGCDEGIERYLPEGLGPWSAFRSSTYGYGHLTVYNATHVHWEQYLDSSMKVLDQMWLVQHHHGAFN